MQRKVNVVEDLDGKKIVFIHDIRFKGRQAIEWNEVEKYLKQYVGESHIIESTKDMVYIGMDLPEIIEIAVNKVHKDNYKGKHNKDAKFGWYRYESRFALPVFDESGEVERYNVFQVILVVRHAEDGKPYLYDIMNIKKETSTHFQFEDLTQSKTRFLIL